MFTFLEPEEKAYPKGGFSRRGSAILQKNEHNPVDLPYGEIRDIRASIPDTYFSIPAKLRYNKRKILGFLTYFDNEYYWTPEADPKRCNKCKPKTGCKQ
jgi:hypothetical protein